MKNPIIDQIRELLNQLEFQQPISDIQTSTTDLSSDAAKFVDNWLYRNGISISPNTAMVEKAGNNEYAFRFDRDRWTFWIHKKLWNQVQEISKGDDATVYWIIQRVIACRFDLHGIKIKCVEHINGYYDGVMRPNYTQA